jgi:6-phosphogluconolactonase (cycloisomerase 2 family)
MSGGIRAVTGSPFAPNTAGGPLAMSRDAKFLYSINTDGSLAAFSIQADGSLLSVPGAPFGTPTYSEYLIAHPTADFLYAEDSSGNIEVYNINPATGALTLQPAAGVAGVGLVLAITRDGNRLYAISQAGINGYSVATATGALTALVGSPFQGDGTGATPVAASIDPSGRFMYVTHEGTSSGFALGPVDAFSIDPQTGAVKLISEFSPTVGPQGSVAVDASGKYAVIGTGVTSKTGPNCFAVASIDGTSGTLSSVAGSPFPGPFNNDCGGLLADPSGSYIYSGSGGVTVYSLDETTGVPQLVTDSALAGMAVESLAVTH